MRQNTPLSTRQDETSRRPAQATEAAPVRQHDEAVLEAACAIDQKALWTTRRIRGFIVTQRPAASRAR